MAVFQVWPPVYISSKVKFVSCLFVVSSPVLHRHSVDQSLFQAVPTRKNIPDGSTLHWLYLQFSHKQYIVLLLSHYRCFVYLLSMAMLATKQPPSTLPFALCSSSHIVWAELCFLVCCLRTVVNYFRTISAEMGCLSLL